MPGKRVQLLEKDAIAIAQDIRNFRAQSSQQKEPGLQTPTFNSRNSRVTVPVYNDGEEPLSIFSIVELKKANASNTVSSLGTIGRGHVRWTAAVPTGDSDAVIGILQTAIAPGFVGAALLIGVSKVRLDDSAEGDSAEVQADDSEKMVTCSGGFYSLLYVEDSASDDTWGVILLGQSVSNEIWVRVKSSTNYQLGGEDVTGVYVYTCERIRQTSPGPGHLEKVPDSEDIEAYADWEEINPNASGSDDPFGIGVYPDQLDVDEDDTDDFAIGAIPNGTPVKAYAVVCTNGETAWRIAAPNAISGSCP